MEQDGYKCMDGTRQSGNVFLSTSPSGQPTAAYTNQQSDGYLTPTSPAPDQPPLLPVFPASFGRSQFKPRATQNNNDKDHPAFRSFPRAGSGKFFSVFVPAACVQEEVQS